MALIKRSFGLKPPLGIIRGDSPLSQMLQVAILLNEGGGTPVESVYGTQGVLQGSVGQPSWASIGSAFGGVGGSGLSFIEANTQSLHLDPSRYQNLQNGPMTVMGWLTASGTDSDLRIASKTDANVAGGWIVSINAGATPGVKWLVVLSSSNHNNNAAGAGGVQGQLINFAVTWNFATLTSQVWMNGVPNVAFTGGSGTSVESGNHDLIIGDSPLFGGLHPFGGVMERFYIWKRILSASEIQQLYVNPNAMQQPARRYVPGTGAGGGQSITGAAGIPSAEAFGCSLGQVNLGSNQGITGCSGGIPSTEAFGVNGGVAVAPNLTGTSGIPSSEAFGVTGGAVSINAGIVGSYGIPSAEAFGHGAVLIRDFAVFLANVDITNLLLAVPFGSGTPQGQTSATVLTITDPLTGPSTASCTLRDPAGLLHPQVGQEFLFYRKGKRLFGGTVEDSAESAFQASKDVVTNLKLNDFSTILDRRAVGKYYDISSGGSLMVIVSDIVRVFLAGDGVSYDTSDGDPGTVLGPINFNWITARDCFNQLAAMTGWDFRVDANKVLRFFPHSTGLELAPFSIQDNDGNWLAESMSVRTYRGKYANRFYGLSNTQSIALWCDTFSVPIPGPYRDQPQPPDNIRQFFVTLYVLTALPVVTRNGAAQIVIPITSVSTYNANSTPWDWYYIPGGFGVVQNFAHSPLGPAEVLKVCYPSQVPPVSFAQDTAQIAARAAIEGNSGIYDQVVQIKDITDPVAIQAYLQGMLTRFGSNGIPREVTFSTYKEGLKVGQLITINTTNPLAPNAQYLINTLTTTDVDKQILLYHVTATTGANPADWTAFFAAINRAAAQPVPSNREVKTWSIPTPQFTGIISEPYVVQNASGLMQSLSIYFATPPQIVGWTFDILINGSGSIAGAVFPVNGQNAVTFFFNSPTRVFAGDILQVLISRSTTTSPGLNCSVTLTISVSL